MKEKTIWHVDKRRINSNTPPAQAGCNHDRAAAAEVIVLVRCTLHEHDFGKQLLEGFTGHCIGLFTDSHMLHTLSSLC